MSRLDRWFEGLSRQSARRVSRRNWLSRFGGVLVGGATLPLLPVARAAEKHTVGEDGVKGRQGDPTRCEYWRHCAIDGFLCSCCGGSHTACPPGTEMSPVT